MEENDDSSVRLRRTSADKQKTLERLIRAIEAVYASPGKVFRRGFLLGLGKGIGSLVGWLILLAIIVWLINISGIGETFASLISTFNQVSDQFQNIPNFGQ